MFYSVTVINNHASYKFYFTQEVRNSKKSCTRFHFFQDFKSFGWDFRFQNHRIRSLSDHVIFNIWRYTKIYSKEFAIRSHTKLGDTAPVILPFAATLRWINGQYTEFTANFSRFQISKSAEIWDFNKDFKEAVRDFKELRTPWFYVTWRKEY